MASSAPDHLRTPGLISNRPCYEGIKIDSQPAIFAPEPYRDEALSHFAVESNALKMTWWFPSLR